MNHKRKKTIGQKEGESTARTSLRRYGLAVVENERVEGEGTEEKGRRTDEGKEEGEKS